MTAEEHLLAAFDGHPALWREFVQWPSVAELATRAVRAAVAEEKERCARVAEACKTTRPDDAPPPTPQEEWEDHGHNAACDWVALQIRGRKT